LDARNPELTKPLNDCEVWHKARFQPMVRGQNHRSFATCAEIVATAMYVKKHNAAPRDVTGANGKPATVKDARMVAWGPDWNPKAGFAPHPEGVAVGPRQAGSDTGLFRFGCLQWAQYQGLRVPGTLVTTRGQQRNYGERNGRIAWVDPPKSLVTTKNGNQGYAGISLDTAQPPGANS
jgi:hypothetical protein